MGCAYWFLTWFMCVLLIKIGSGDMRYHLVRNTFNRSSDATIFVRHRVSCLYRSEPMWICIFRVNRQTVWKSFNMDVVNPLTTINIMCLRNLVHGLFVIHFWLKTLNEILKKFKQKSNNGIIQTVRTIYIFLVFIFLFYLSLKTN